MAKSQQRSNREQKKPKQEKPKPTVGQSAFTTLHERPAVPTPTKKKRPDLVETKVAVQEW
jgi:hypothetical protein